jgi:hypothetical protein
MEENDEEERNRREEMNSGVTRETTEHSLY